MRVWLMVTLQAAWPCFFGLAMQHYPATWGHYDMCKSQVYTDDGLTWDYMACQPEAADMTQYLKVTLDPPDITCGDPPETYCALVSVRTVTVPLSGESVWKCFCCCPAKKNRANHFTPKGLDKWTVRRDDL